MFFFFPYTTNAPIYHLPLATVAMIFINSLVFGGMINGSIADPEAWVLTYGQGLHPVQWLTCMFTHGDFGHLAGNMFFLWVFGLVVEGKIGWWKFLLSYLGIGVSHGMCEQLVMLGYSGEVPGSLGASAAIFGLMGMAALWAPLSEITFLWILLIRWGTFDIGVYILAAFYTGYEMLMVTIFGSGAGSSLLHLSGLALGVPLGLMMLKQRWVDCDNDDLLSIWSGKHDKLEQEPSPAEVFAKVDAQRQKRDEQMLVGAKQQVAHFLRQGNAAAALKLSQKMNEVGGGLKLDRGELMAIIQALHVDKRWQESAPLMAEFITRFPAAADAMRIKLAQICVVELQRPGKALELLADVDKSKLTEQHTTLAKRIVAKARQLQAEGTVELDDDAW
jgi:membrane associated rhomboid family serine protease